MPGLQQPPTEGVGFNVPKGSHKVFPWWLNLIIDSAGLLYQTYEETSIPLTSFKCQGPLQAAEFDLDDDAIEAEMLMLSAKVSQLDRW